MHQLEGGGKKTEHITVIIRDGEGKTRTIAGNDVAVGSDSICVHSDTPNAVAIAHAVREAVRPYLSAR